LTVQVTDYANKEFVTAKTVSSDLPVKLLDVQISALNTENVIMAHVTVISDGKEKIATKEILYMEQSKTELSNVIQGGPAKIVTRKFA
jgi:hypothetical protein